MTQRKRIGDGIVYSSEHGKMCPDCGKTASGCVCRQTRLPLPVEDAFVRVGRETAGRKGSGVTVVTGVALGQEDLAALCTRLKKLCGSGGTVKSGTIEIQGDHRDAIIAELTKSGLKVKRVGG